MPLPSKKERDAHQKGSMAEEFRLSKEAKWQGPTLEQKYWANPNAQKGDMAICSYASPMETEIHKHEGV